MLLIFFFRFADVLGLDLDEVKTFLDEIPKVPKSAYNDLKDAELSDYESSASDSGSEPVMSRFQVRYYFVSGFKVHIFWEGHKILRNLHLTFVLCSASQK